VTTWDNDNGDVEGTGWSENAADKRSGVPDDEAAKRKWGDNSMATWGKRKWGENSMATWGKRDD